MTRMSAIFFVFLAVAGYGQTALDSAGFAAWRAVKLDFVAFDVRGDAQPDSIVYPCFYTPQAAQWVDSLNCLKRLLIYCHAGVLAHAVADSIVAHGYPPDSVYYSGYSILAGSRFAATDTLPLSFLATARTIPASPSALELQAIIVSKRPYRVVDVRSAAEIAASGCIPGACNIPWPTPFQASMDRFSRDETIILYCASGNRAGQARNYMLGQGFDSAKVDSFGGFSKWSTAGLVISGQPTTTCACVGIENAGSGRQAAGRMKITATPNPFNPFTRITWNNFESKITNYDLRIFNIRGEIVKDVTSDIRNSKFVIGNSFLWDASSQPSGVYLVKIRAGNTVQVKAITLVK